jgi:hypothetical protein
VSEATPPPKLVLFYTTALQTRPTYRRGILDCLSYPNGHVLQYSYRIGQIDPLLRGTTSLHEGSHGAIVFVDEASPREYVYYALRRVRVLRGLPADVEKRLADRERAAIVLELHDFVEYASTKNPRQWHDRISAFDGARNIRDGKPEYFVIETQDIFTKASVTQLSAWEDVATNLAQSHDLANATFLNIEHPQNFESQVPLTLESSRNAPQYRVRPGQAYRLNIAIYDNKGRETRLKLASSSDDLVQVNQPFQSVVSGLSQKSALISCKRSIENRSVFLSVQVEEDSTQQASNSTVTAPNPTLLLRVEVPWRTLITFFLLVAVGAFFVSWDPDLIKELSCTPHIKTWGLIAKGVGAIALAFAAWIGFRKLPAVSG